MLLLINNENEKEFKMAIFSHDDGFQVQLIDFQTCDTDVVLPNAETVVRFGKAYGFLVSEIELKTKSILGGTRFEDQSVAF
jgi:hypothetical protein